MLLESGYLVGDLKVVEIVGQGRNADGGGGDAVVADGIGVRRRGAAFAVQEP